MIGGSSNQNILKTNITRDPSSKDKEVSKDSNHPFIPQAPSHLQNAMPSNEEAFHQGMYVKISHASTSSDIAHILQSGDVPPDSNNMQA